MKKTLLLILFILASSFSDGHTLEKQDTTVQIHAEEANANQNQAQENTVDTPPALKPADSPDKSESASPDANNNHAEDNEGHKETLLWGYKLSNILAFSALLLTAIFGGTGIWLSLCGLRQNRISNQSQNRAYVHANKAQIINDMFGVRISLEGINTGQTPAKWWATAFKCGTYKPAEAKLQDLLNFDEMSDFSRWPSLASNIPLTAGLDCEGGKSLIFNAKQNRELCFFIYGIIRYETMFNEIFESQFVFYHANPLIGDYLSRPNIKTETYVKT